MSALVYQILHVAAGFLLVAYTFQAFAAPSPEKRKGVLMMSGIASLVMLVGGFGLLAKLDLGFPSWVLIKVILWLVLSALAGIAFRKPLLAKPLSLITIALVVLALYMVYAKPAIG